MVHRTPTKKYVAPTPPEQPRTMSTSDLTSITTSSIDIEKMGKILHSPIIQHKALEQKIASTANFLLQSENTANKIEQSASNINEFNCASLTKDNNYKSDVGQFEQKLVQTGMDRYITVQNKRKRSPRSAASASVNKFSKVASVELVHENRFSVLQTNETTEDPPTENKVNTEKPPPIYLREESNSELMKQIEVLTEGNFYVSSIKRGNIKETKIQPLNIDAYRTLINHFDRVGKRFYTYQLKSQKGLVVMIKGIDSYVDTSDIQAALAAEGFIAKSITNIINRDKLPQPMFRLELETDNKPVKGKHSIYNLRYLLHRRITVEEPKKRTGPVQCIKCQEYGHTRAYCTLNDVCVICGELHSSKQCNKSKTDVSAKRCSNCAGNHTANYRGCPVYIDLRRRINPRQRAEQRMFKLHQTNTEVQPEEVYSNRNQKPTVNSAVHPNFSYASILKGISPKVQTSEEGNISTALNKLTDMMQSFMAMMERTMGLMMQNMNTLMQVVVKNQK